MASPDQTQDFNLTPCVVVWRRNREPFSGRLWPSAFSSRRPTVIGASEWAGHLDTSRPPLPECTSRGCTSCCTPCGYPRRPSRTRRDRDNGRWPCSLPCGGRCSGRRSRLHRYANSYHLQIETWGGWGILQNFGCYTNLFVNTWGHLQISNMVLSHHLPSSSSSSSYSLLLR